MFVLFSYEGLQMHEEEPLVGLIEGKNNVFLSSQENTNLFEWPSVVPITEYLVYKVTFLVGQ